MEDMNKLLWNILKEHYGHKVEIAIYGDEDNPANICLEDMDTNEVILDAEIYTICAREDNEKEFTDDEVEIIERLNNARNYLPYGYELEMDWSDGEGKESLAGWYAYKYNEVYGQATIIDNLPLPLITEKEIVEKDIDIDKCLEKCCCYVCG